RSNQFSNHPPRRLPLLTMTGIWSKSMTSASSVLSQTSAVVSGLYSQPHMMMQ
ncbi:unnamed protein product, partial [Candidula unifasciata]